MAEEYKDMYQQSTEELDDLLAEVTTQVVDGKILIDLSSIMVIVSQQYIIAYGLHAAGIISNERLLGLSAMFEMLHAISNAATAKHAGDFVPDSLDDMA